MGLKYRKLDKILEVFFEYPGKQFTIREISKRTNIPKSTVKNYLDELKRENIITKKNSAEESEFYKIIKTHYYVEKFVQSGLVQYLAKELTPSVMMLFGSFRKGESEKDSDIDVFIETTKKKELDLSDFEKKLKHKIELFISDDIQTMPKSLRNNIVNGIKLYGYLKIR